MISLTLSGRYSAYQAIMGVLSVCDDGLVLKKIEHGVFLHLPRLAALRVNNGTGIFTKLT